MGGTNHLLSGMILQVGPMVVEGVTLTYMCDRVDQLPWHFHIGDKLINPSPGGGL